MKRKLRIAEEPSAEIAAATSIVQGLQARRKELDARIGDLAVERERLSFVAIVEADPAAKSRLEEINTESMRLTLEAENVESAIREAEAQVMAASNRAAELTRIHCAKETLSKMSQREKLASDIETALSSAVPLIEHYVALGREAGITPHWDGLCISSLMNRLLLPLSRAKVLALSIPDIQLRKPLAELAAHGHAIQKKRATDVLAAADAALVAQNGRAA